LRSTRIANISNHSGLVLHSFKNVEITKGLMKTPQLKDFCHIVDGTGPLRFFLLNIKIN
jgi:hypothetical protein